MNTTAQLAKHIKELYFGGNWTAANLKKHLSDITWQQATQKVADLNTIVVLVYHINYYVIAITGVLQGKPLEAKDKYSFDAPEITNEEDWQQMITQVLESGEQLANLVEELPDELLPTDFTDSKYGSYHRNILGFIEHTHYHLGQIALLKKLV